MNCTLRLASAAVLDPYPRFVVDCCASFKKKKKKKKKGRARVEPATYRAATDCSTTELTPQVEHKGRIAQSVERWSNKPLVMGSIHIVPTFVFVLLKNQSINR